GRAEQVADLGKRETEQPRSADESQPPLIGRGVLAESRAMAFGQRKQAFALIEPDSLHAHAGLGRELPDRQTSHTAKLAAVPRYGVKSLAAGAPAWPGNAFAAARIGFATQSKG